MANWLLTFLLIYFLGVGPSIPVSGVCGSGLPHSDCTLPVSVRESKKNAFLRLSGHVEAFAGTFLPRTCVCRRLGQDCDSYSKLPT
jgi:hypothetical protein